LAIFLLGWLGNLGQWALFPSNREPSSSLDISLIGPSLSEISKMPAAEFLTTGYKVTSELALES
jgi:hypothetical protein